MAILLRKSSAFAVSLILPLAALQLPAQEVIEEVVVTAQKREQSLQDVSVSVTAVSELALIENGVNDISRLDTLVPGLTFGQAGNDPAPTLRGARTAQVEANDVSVAFYTDGIYRPRHGQALAGFVDVQRVEVLRGPQGTLFGRNSYGGAINVITKRPSSGELDYGIALTGGDYSLFRGEGFFNVPINEQVAFRITGSSESRDPYVENALIGDAGGLKDADNWYIRGQLLFEPSDELDVLVRAERWEDDANGNADFGYKVLGVPVNLATGLTNGVTGTMRQRIGRSDECTGTCGRQGAGFDFVATPGLDTAQATIADPFTISNDFSPMREIEETTLSGELNWSGLGFADLKITLAYMDYAELRLADSDLSDFSSLVAGNDITSETTSQEIQFTSANDGPFQWVGGLFFLQEDLMNAFLWQDLNGLFSGNLVDNAPDPTIPPTNTWAPWLREIRIDTRSIAAYGQGTFSVSDTVRLIAGIRFTEDDRDWDIFGPPSETDAPAPGDLSVLEFSTPLLQGASESWDKVTWKAGAEWDVSDAAMAYFTASTGFLSGNAQGAFNDDGTYDERTVIAYELGLKTTLLDGAMTFNVAAFHNEYDDLLATSFVDTGGTTLAFSDNAGEAMATGLEIEADWVPVDRATVGVRASFQNAEFGNFVTNNVFEEGGQTINNVDNLFQLDGMQISKSPDVTFTLLGNYDIDLGNNGTLTPGITFYYSDDYRTADAPFFYAVQDSFTRTDLTLGWNSIEGNWNALLFVRNLEDEEIQVAATRFGGNVAIADYAPPRTYGVRLGYRF